MSNPLINEYLDKQAVLTAVKTFSKKHDDHEFEPNQTIYKELLPQTTPGKGQQYAFEVDLDKCTGCKACVTACHNENGLAEDETWRSVGLVQGGDSNNPALQHITTACHHCLEPACMKGCPTKAYVKDEETGVVKHLDDQCFGCQYCILKCPYDVPKYSNSKGIVHKCDMCIGRLKEGQPPACVKACPNGAIRITIVDQQKVKTKPSDFVDVPDSPNSNYTYPTTKYKTNKKFPQEMVSMDYHTVEPEHSHSPLVVMLVLTQLSVGTFLTDFILKHQIDFYLSNLLGRFHLLVALGIGLLALVSSIFHLGRPQYFFRAILGLQTSWLSREIIAFATFAKIAILFAVCSWFTPIGDFIGQFMDKQFAFDLMAYAVIGFGVIGVLCSVMVYRDTQRPFWDNHLTTVKFLGTTAIMGCSTILLTAVIFGGTHQTLTAGDIMRHFGEHLCLIMGMCMFAKLILEGSIFYHLTHNELTFFKKTALLMTKQLQTKTKWRFLTGIIGGLLLPLILINLTSSSTTTIIVVSSLIFGLTLTGELLERYLFFRAVVPLKMPGGSAS